MFGLISRLSLLKGNSITYIFLLNIVSLLAKKSSQLRGTASLDMIFANTTLISFNPLAKIEPAANQVHSSVVYLDVTTLSNDDYVITWQYGTPNINSGSTSYSSIYGSNFVAPYSRNFVAPSIAGQLGTEDGFVLVYSSTDSSYGTYGQCYAVDGEETSTTFQVNTYATNIMSQPAIAALISGGFTITWINDGRDGSGYGIYGQRYTNSCSKSGLEFQVNTYSTNAQTNPAIAGLTNGGFVVVWQSEGQDGSDYGIYGQRYASSGSKSDSEFQISTYTTNAQTNPAIAGLTNGGFITVWQSEGQDGSNNGIYGQRYDSSGSKSGSEFQVNTDTTNDQSSPDIAALANGGFIVVWLSNNVGYNIYGRRFTSSGVKNGAEFKINSDTSTYSLSVPTITTFSDNSFVVVWGAVYYEFFSFTSGVVQQLFNANGQATTARPTLTPTRKPTVTPSLLPSRMPTINPTLFSPTKQPTLLPTIIPTTFRPTSLPTKQPTFKPTSYPSFLLTHQPTLIPSFSTTFQPTLSPTFPPSFSPNWFPTSRPTDQLVLLEQPTSEKQSLALGAIIGICIGGGIFLILMLIYFYNKTKPKIASELPPNKTEGNQYTSIASSAMIVDPSSIECIELGSSLPPTPKENNHTFSAQPICKIPEQDILRGKFLGRGQYGEVYQGRWNKKNIALKIYAGLDLPDEIRTMLYHEVDVMKQFNCLYLVSLYGVLEESEKYGLVLEYCAGKSLYSRLYDGNDLSLEIRLQIAYDIAQGLAFLHACALPIVHADLKSHNILLTEKNRAKIGDFGLSKIKAHINTTSTSIGSSVGTPRWMAPELFNGKKNSKKSDIYSLGMVFWELATRTLPYADSAGEAQLRERVVAKNRDVFPQDCSKPWRSLTERCWEYEQENRPSAEEVVSEIKTWSRYLK